MKDFVEYMLVKEMLEDKNESDGDGCLVLLVPLFIIGVILLILNKMGISPLEVWTMVKILIYPSTWDWQLNKGFSHLWASLMMVLSFIGTFGVTFAIGYVFELLLDLTKKFTFPLVRVFHGLLDIIDKLLIYILIGNMMFIGLRFAFHFIWGSLVWLAN